MLNKFSDETHIPIFIASNSTRIVNITCLDFALQRSKWRTSHFYCNLFMIRYMVQSDERVKFTLKIWGYTDFLKVPEGYTKQKSLGTTDLAFCFLCICVLKCIFCKDTPYEY